MDYEWMACILAYFRKELTINEYGSFLSAKPVRIDQLGTRREGKHTSVTKG